MKNNTRYLTIFALSLLFPPPLFAQLSTNTINLADFTHCATGMQSGDDAAESLTSGAECAANVAMDAVIRAGISHLNANGKQFFGRGFSFVSSMRYSPFDGSHLQGDIDMVVPLSFGGGDQAAANLRSAWFMQNGLTRWTDSHGLRRNDVRFGFVHRFTAGLDQHGAPNLLGAYALLQQNRERGHQRMVVGMDYAGRWGKGFINHYAPQSGWQAGRVGYQERAVGGAEIGVSLTPTTALDMSLAAGEWDTTDGRQLSGRATLAWQPHTYLRLSSDVSGIGGDHPQTAYRIAFHMPLGQTQQRPQWHWLGLKAGSAAKADDLWRRVAVVNRIEVIEHEHSLAALVEGAQVRFLQTAMYTGNAIRVEITLPAPAPQNARVEVRLRPGEGANPAVAGIDFSDLPVTVSIPEGGTTAIATLQLMYNPDLTANRSLSVKVRAIEG